MNNEPDAAEYPRFTTAFAVSIYDNVPDYRRKAALAAVLAFCSAIEEHEPKLAAAYRNTWAKKVS